MTTITIHLPKLHPGQQDIKRSLNRFNVINCGRRFGKTTLGLDLTEPTLSGKLVGWFSPTYKMLLDVWRDARRIFGPVVKRASVQERRFELITGGILEMWSLDNPDAARGRKYDRVIIDEAALVPRLMDAWQAAIRATLTDSAGDAFFLSTPKGHNFFKTLFDYGSDPAQEVWSSWQMPTASNPHIATGEIEAARFELPEWVFQQEYLAQFIEDAGVFRGVVDCAVAVESPPVAGRRYVMGVDWGKMSDFTAIIVYDTTDNQQVYLDRFNQIDYTVQSGRLKEVYRKYRPYRVLAESNSMGEPIIDQLRSEGLKIEGFQTTANSKSRIVGALSLAFEKREIAILPDPVLIAELQAYEATRLPSGMLRYSAPEGAHDDTVMALALAWEAMHGQSVLPGVIAQATAKGW